MKSTDNNINNPLKVDTLHLAREVESWQFMKVLYVTQKNYDTMNFYDPHTAYIIKDPGSTRVYYGSILVDNDSCSYIGNPRYVMGITSEGEYAIFMNIPSRLIQISRYADAQKAFEALKLLSNIGSYYEIDWRIYNLITKYIDKDITCNQLIISIMIEIYNIKDLPAFQTFIHTLTLDGADKEYKDISRMLREDLDRWTSSEFQKTDPHNQQMYKMMSIYSGIYNIIVLYDFFKADKYHDPSGDIDLSPVINDIYHKVINNHLNDFDKWVNSSKI